MPSHKGSCALGYQEFPVCHYYIYYKIGRILVVRICQLMVPCHLLSGELDPDRMGSGIQYGDPSLRRTIRPGKQDERQKCAC